MSGWTAASVVLLTASALALAWIARSALRGADATTRSALLLTTLVVVAAYAILAEHPALAAGTRTALVLLRLSWIIAVVAAILVVAGAVAAAGRATKPRPLWHPIVLTALAIGLTVALVGGALGRAWSDTAVTASPIDIPAVPSAVGDDTAYVLPTEYPGFIVPAGPGFVLLDGDTLVGYAGDTGEQRWRLPFDVVGLDCAPSSVRSTGTSADSVVIAQCLRTRPSSASSSSSPSDSIAVLTGVDAMTGRVLWTNADNWRIRSTIVTGPDVVPVLRAGDVGALDPRTGNLRWVKRFDQGECGGNIVGLGNPAQEIVYFPVCADEFAVQVADGRTGAERTLRVESPELEPDMSRTELVAAAGGVIVVKASSTGSGPSVTLAVDVGSGDTVRVPVEYLRRDRGSFDAGQYPGAVLQLSERSERTTVYLVAERRAVETSAPTLDAVGIMDGQLWAAVGDRLVTATAATAGYRALLATVAEDGTATGRPSPCGGSDYGGILTVPGAVLVVCARTEYSEATEYFVVGLR